LFHVLPLIGAAIRHIRPETRQTATINYLQILDNACKVR
jgi:hypothetical protein